MPRSFNEWDSLSLAEVARHERFFGNRNIGDIRRTSLQVSGQLTPLDDIAIVTHWYARLSLSSDLGGYQQDVVARLSDQFAHDSVVSWRINDRSIWKASLADLFWHRTGLDRAAPRLYWPEVIRPRSFLGADIMPGGLRFSSLAFLDLPTVVLEQSRIYLHLCGLRLVDNENETDAQYVDKVMASLTRAQGERQSVEQRIVDWVLGTAKGMENQEDAAQLMAIADGILEGRHR